MIGKDPMYKNNRKCEFIPSCSLDKNYFKKLYKILDEASEESAKYEIDKLKKKEGQSLEDFEKYKEGCRKLFNVGIHIYGAKGEFSLSESDSIFDDSGLPSPIIKIMYENHAKYKVRIKNEPENYFSVTFDFSKPKVLDFITSPSYATPNNSVVDVFGNNETWVISTFTKIKESLGEHVNKRGWLHQNNIYDVFLWFLFLPLSFRILYLLDKHVVSNTIASASIFFKIIIYFYFLIISLNLFRFIFNYARWIFPNLEFSNNKSEKKHRKVLYFIVFAVIGPVIFDVVRAIYSLLVKSG